jgi:hypothetical protein
MVRAELSPTGRRLAFAAVVAYVALVGYEVVTGDPTAGLAAELLFGVALVAFGGRLAVGGDLTPLSSAAAASLVGAGLAALGGLVTGQSTFRLVSDTLLIVGLVALLADRYMQD